MNRKEHLKRIMAADTTYYDNAAPIMSDQEYDILRASYISRYGTKDLDYVPGKPITKNKFKHPIEVTSLAKVDEADVEKYESELKRLAPVVVEPKYDGLTVVAYPDGNGHYFFVTRGSGTEGDVLPNFHPMNKFAPPETSYDNTKYAIRGEAFLTQSAFERMNEELVRAGKKPKANPRNAAAGILNPARKDKSPYMAFISYICYDVIGMDAPESEKLKYIREHTPFVATNAKTFASPYDYAVVREKIEAFYQQTKENGIPIDGMVIKTDQPNSMEHWGSTSHHPRNATALKKNQTSVTSTLRDIHWQVGKTGTVTPVADFDPIEILGSTVSQASLSNPEEIDRLGLHIGDQVAVIKAKEIVPKIVLNYGGGKKEIEIPDICPSCHKSLAKDGPTLRCVNSNCKEKLAQKLAFIAHKDVLDIPGWAIETCRKIVNVTDPDFKDFTFDDLFWNSELEFVDYFGEKTAKKLTDAMKHALNTPHPFRNWLPSLCIEGVGHSAADKLMQYFHTVDVIESAIFSDDKEELLKVSGFGEIIVDKLLSDEFKARWTMMKYCFPIQSSQVSISKSSYLLNKNFVLTGKMDHPRSYYEDLIKQHGGNVSSSVTKNTDYLVIADPNSTSTKAQKARKLGIKLISPEELKKLIGDVL